MGPYIQLGQAKLIVTFQNIQKMMWAVIIHYSISFVNIFFKTKVQKLKKN